MPGKLNIDVLLKSLKAELVDGVYVFVTLADDAIPPNLTPRMMFREAEGTTLILEQEQADAAGIDYAFPCRMITLDVHSSLEAVGFMARIATELAKAGMGVNPVAGFYHDHLFVPEGREQNAPEILAKLAAQSK